MCCTHNCFTSRISVKLTILSFQIMSSQTRLNQIIMKVTAIKTAASASLSEPELQEDSPPSDPAKEKRIREHEETNWRSRGETFFQERLAERTNFLTSGLKGPLILAEEKEFEDNIDEELRREALKESSSSLPADVFSLEDLEMDEGETDVQRPTVVDSYLARPWFQADGEMTNPPNSTYPTGSRLSGLVASAKPSEVPSGAIWVYPSSTSAHRIPSWNDPGTDALLFYQHSGNGIFTLVKHRVKGDKCPPPVGHAYARPDHFVDDPVVLPYVYVA